MRAHDALRATFTILFTLALTACPGEQDEPSEQAPTGRPAWPGERVALDEAKLDASTVRVRADGLTVWLEPEIAAHDDAGEARFVIRGSASRDLDEVAASALGSALGDARITSARRFEVELDARQMEWVALGAPLSIALFAASAPHPRYVVEARARARIGPGSGERGIQLESALVPVLVDGAVLHRGTVVLGEGIHDVLLSTATADDVPLVPQDDGTLRFDIDFDALARAAVSYPERLLFVGWRRSGMVWRRASTALSLAEIAITHLDPADVWPVEACDDATRACLEARGGTAGDTSACGRAWSVISCQHELARDEGRADDLASRFVDDLRTHLVTWYAVRGEDVRRAGGATLEEARESVAIERVEEVLDPEADPWAHDLATTRVLAHPDVVFPGSDRWWMGAYDRTSGELLDIYSIE